MSPQRTQEEIKNLALSTIEEYYKNDVPLPIDVEEIMELGLKLKPYILPQLEAEFSNGGEAFLTAGNRVVVIDESLYTQESRRERLRFSLGHEIGHYILHKSLFEDIKDIDEYLQRMESIKSSVYDRIEREANSFAGHLLVPIKYLELQITDFEKQFVDWDLAYTGTFVEDMRKRFECTPTVVAIQCKRSLLKEFSNIGTALDQIIQYGKHSGRYF